MRFFILGGSGFVGQALIPYLIQRQHQVDVLIRDPSQKDLFPHESTCHQGDPVRSGEWQDVAARAEAIVNLVGKNIMTRWTPQVKNALLQTRIQPTRMAVQAIEKAAEPKPVLVNANAVGYYPLESRTAMTEAGPQGSSFLAHICGEWQKEAEKAGQLGARVVIARFAPVLGRGGGMIEKLLPIFSKGLGGRVGSGRQAFPWIHRHDLVRAIEFAAVRETMSGPVNMCAPEQITNAEFTKALAGALKRPAPFPVPGPVLKLAYGELAQMLLKGAPVEPRALEEAGFEFSFPTLSQALEDLLTARSREAQS
jgi:hypothetical protein